MSTADATGRLDFDSLESLHWLGVVLAAVTGVVHLYLGVSSIDQALGWAFLVAGVGFLAGSLAVLLDYRRPLLYLLGIPFALGQMVAWYLLNAPDFSTTGYADKAVQAVLVVVLVVLYRRESGGT